MINNINGNSNFGASATDPISTSNTLSATATVTSLTNELQDNCLNQNSVPSGDWICFNFGKELYTYSYRGVKKVGFLCSYQ